MIRTYQKDTRRKPLMVDPSLQMAAHNTWSDRPLECYDLIRGLFHALGFDAAAYGDWMDIQILRADNRGHKRARNQTAHPVGGANLVVDQGAGAGALL
jgi:hypothetical protein